MGVGNAMKIYTTLGGEIMDIINKRLEDGPTNKEESDRKGVRD